jgi:c-di-GMP-binding flagellar brake protein YcgR
MDPIKMYVVGKEKADVICPSCGRAKVIHFVDTDMSQNCEIECICRNTILVIFEKRRFFRRRVLLTGTCFSKSDPPEGTTVKISNLSRTGMLFLKDTGEKLELNETIRLRFRPKLSNNVIRCTALVKNIGGTSFGAKFLNLDLNAQKLIGSCVRA